MASPAGPPDFPACPAKVMSRPPFPMNCFPRPARSTPAEGIESSASTCPRPRRAGDREPARRPGTGCCGTSERLDPPPNPFECVTNNTKSSERSMFLRRALTGASMSFKPRGFRLLAYFESRQHARGLTNPWPQSDSRARCASPVPGLRSACHRQSMALIEWTIEEDQPTMVSGPGRRCHYRAEWADRHRRLVSTKTSPPAGFNGGRSIRIAPSSLKPKTALPAKLFVPGGDSVAGSVQSFRPHGNAFRLHHVAGTCERRENMRSPDELPDVQAP